MSGSSRPVPAAAMVGALVAALLALPGTATPAASTQLADSTQPADTGAGVARAAQQGATATVDPALSRQLAGGRARPFWVRFTSTASLARAAGIDDWARRGAAVVDQLTTTARRSQRGVAAVLRREDVASEAFWVTNSIYVYSGTEGLAERLAGTPGVRSIDATSTVPMERVAPGRPQSARGAVEWGIRNIHANKVWADFADRGRNIVVASIDTGVQFDHPALVRQYRGNEGGGIFHHAYNWYDPAGDCPTTEPCDPVGHGTHTMGTMVGDGGAHHHIGVAPGARWISAKACEEAACTELALTRAAQWIVAPTDLTGQHPDPAVRPNIVNNSWGGPAGDDWYSDFVDAWVAAGIFPQFSVGNSGPRCNSAGTPGEYPQSYSAGMYASNNVIDPQSSRGPGLAGQSKPDIAAPGVNVSSSVPGDGYAAYTGSSMASPHVAGTVALAWSAAPALIGNIDATRALLDGSAVDSEDLTCGGSATDNNVYGQGRLDAYLAVSSAREGPSGMLTGSVVSGRDGAPLAGAKVIFSGSVTRTTRTNARGRYNLTVAPGTYRLRVTHFGYFDASLDGVAVGDGESVVQSFRLDALPSAELSGLVRDGSGHGWPLYAKVTAVGIPDAVTYTDPETGEFAMTLPTGRSYTIETDVVGPGYDTVSATWWLPADVNRVVVMRAELTTCAIPGYQLLSGPVQGFDSAEVPPGWTVFDHEGGGHGWVFDNPGGRTNVTGGEGNFAVVDSDAFGSGARQDSSLVSPRYDMTQVADPIVEFKSDYRTLSTESAKVDLSLDGGTSWTNVWTQDADARGPRTVRIPIPQAGNEANVRVRFRYGVAEYSWWWELDDVMIGRRRCAVVPGGLVDGYVTDANTGEALNGATVTVGGDAAATGATASTPADEAVADGFFLLFSPGSGSRELTATLASYTSANTEVFVDPGRVSRADPLLAAGQLSVGRDRVIGHAQLGTTVTRHFRITNSGTVPTTAALSETGGGFVGLRATQLRGATGTVAPHSRAEVPWMAATPASIDLGPGETTSVALQLAADAVDQPGRYTARVIFAQHTPYAMPPLKVTLFVSPPPSWGKITGRIRARSCAGEVAALLGATVQIDSRREGWSLSTDGDGRYARWMRSTSYPMQVIVAKDGYRPVVRPARIIPGETLRLGAVLTERGC